MKDQHLKREYSFNCNIFRQQLITVLSQELSSVSEIHDIWRQTARPCIPRLLCSFQQNRRSQLSAKNASEVEQNPDSYASRAKIKSKAPPKSPLINLQRALEEQIYSIMRKSRLLGSLSSSSLFTVNSSHNFVHVQAYEVSQSADMIGVLLKSFKKPSILDQFKSSSFSQANSTVVASENSDNSNPDFSGHILLRDFLREQIDNLMTGDGRDGLSEGRRGTHVEVPTIRQWAKVCVCIFGYLTSERSDENSHLIALANNLDLEMKFSDARCRKVLPIASNAYLDNLPLHYPQRIHLSKMTQALRVFSINARGPAYETYAIQLQQECIKMWVSGRQLCEVHSLTGRHCIYPFHLVPGQPMIDSPLIDKTTLSYKQHSSRITTLCACNCGRTQGQREDPFDLKSANYDFYQNMVEKCCSSLVHLSLPIHFSAQHDDITTGNDDSDDVSELPSSQHLASIPDEEKQNAETAEQSAPQIPDTTDTKPLNKDAKEFVSSHVSSVLSGGYQSVTEIDSNYHKSVTSVGSAGGTDVLSGDVYHGDVIEPRKHRESTTENADYLECMLSSEPTGGRLPLFPSWSLCRLGNSSTYQPSKGLDHPGFFPGTNILLAWDIPLLNDNQSGLTSYIDSNVKHPGVKTAGIEAWPAPNELPSANSNIALPLYQTLVYAARQCTDYNVNPLPISTTIAGNKGASSRNQRNQYPTVRAYIGNEYECPRGHRFICSSHDKMVKVNNSGVLKETAVRLVNSDMPLYFPCPCRTNKPLLAQLTRLFAVTPESPVLITLKPRVQPAPAPCPVFHPGPETGITLPPASICVLRLPFVYVGLEGPISHLSEGQPLSDARLLRGTYGVMRNARNFDEKEMWSF